MPCKHKLKPIKVKPKPVKPKLIELNAKPKPIKPKNSKPKPIKPKACKPKPGVRKFSMTNFLIVSLLYTTNLS